MLIVVTVIGISFAHILTVINNETANHRFHIDVFNVQTDLLEPGDQELSQFIQIKKVNSHILIKDKIKFH